MESDRIAASGGGHGLGDEDGASKEDRNSLIWGPSLGRPLLAASNSLAGQHRASLESGRLSRSWGNMRARPSISLCEIRPV